jgi:8-oxo-dGTP pyrophosphatase MutT (NUDIX family)
MTSAHRGVGIIVRNRAATCFYVQQKDANYRPHPRGYSLFGGAVEPGEAALEALARELDEELGAAAQLLLATQPTLVHETRMGPSGFWYSLFEVVLDDASLDTLARAPVFEGERGALVSREQLRTLPFVWGLEAVVLAYLDGI